MDCWERLARTLHEEKCILIRITPGAKRLGITCTDGFHIALPAPARDGKANQALIKLIKKKTRLSVRITHGLTKREKRICLQ